MTLENIYSSKSCATTWSDRCAEHAGYRRRTEANPPAHHAAHPPSTQDRTWTTWHYSNRDNPDSPSPAGYHRSTAHRPLCQTQEHQIHRTAPRTSAGHHRTYSSRPAYHHTAPENSGARTPAWRLQLHCWAWQLPDLRRDLAMGFSLLSTFYKNAHSREKSQILWNCERNYHKRR